MIDLTTFAERGWLPDGLVRLGIRRLLRDRLASELAERGNATPEEVARQFAEAMRSRHALAEATDAANTQHYEVPAQFYEACLGPRLKYSSGYWPDHVSTLAASEEAMLALTCEHAELAEGQQILELGCGWGSLTLWMAEQYPSATITAMSNSASQRAHIERKAAERGLANVTVLTEDINRFEPVGQFDRVVSVEMFEHVRRHDLLFQRIAGWLKPEGKLFTHVFCHRWLPYLFELNEGNDWMARHFFTGGMMPSEPLFAEYNDHLQVEQQWWINGTHYARTCNAWLETMDAHRVEALDALDDHPDGARLQFGRWRLFYMACAELFGFEAGDTWGVAHYRMQRR